MAYLFDGPDDIDYLTEQRDMHLKGAEEGFLAKIGDDPDQQFYVDSMGTNRDWALGYIEAYHDPDNTYYDPVIDDDVHHINKGLQPTEADRDDAKKLLNDYGIEDNDRNIEAIAYQVSHYREISSEIAESFQNRYDAVLYDIEHGISNENPLDQKIEGEALSQVLETFDTTSGLLHDLGTDPNAISRSSYSMLDLATRSMQNLPVDEAMLSDFIEDDVITNEEQVLLGIEIYHAEMTKPVEEREGAVSKQPTDVDIENAKKLLEAYNIEQTPRNIEGAAQLEIISRVTKEVTRDMALKFQAQRNNDDITFRQLATQNYDAMGIENNNNAGFGQLIAALTQFFSAFFGKMPEVSNKVEDHLNEHAEGNIARANSLTGNFANRADTPNNDTIFDPITGEAQTETPEPEQSATEEPETLPGEEIAGTKIPGATQGV